MSVSTTAHRRTYHNTGSVHIASWCRCPACELMLPQGSPRKEQRRLTADVRRNLRPGSERKAARKVTIMRG